MNQIEKIKTRDNTLYHVVEIQTELTKSTFILNRSKQDCNKIVFSFNDGAELKGLLLNLFQNSKPFDFKIAEVLPDNCCKIYAVKMPWV